MKNKYSYEMLSFGPADAQGNTPNGGGPGDAAPAEDNFYSIPKVDELDSGDTNGGGDAGDTVQAGAGGDDENFGDGNDTVQAGAGEGDDTVVAGDGVEGQQQQQQPSATPGKLLLDPDSIQALAAALKPQVTGEPNQQPQYTPEQIKKMFNPVEVTPELLQNIRSEDPNVAMKALQDFANATVKNAFSITKVMLAKKEAEFKAMLEPITQNHTQAQASQTQQAFYTKYAHLVPYKRAVKMATQEVSPTRADGSQKTDDEIFQEVATKSEEIVKSFGVDVKKPNANHGAGAGNGQGVPRPNRFQAPGRSGGDSNPGKNKQSNDQAEIYARR